MKTLVFIATFFLFFNVSAQETVSLNMYEFKIKTITDPAVAKGVIDEIRELLTVKIVYFNDETDTFRILDPQSFTNENIKMNLLSVGLELETEVVIKTDYSNH